jgi:hypothetical protein
MIWSFLLGAVAGFVTPMVEPYVRRAMEGVALAKIPISDTEFDVLTLVILLIVAALLSFGAPTLALLLGALVGVVGKHFITGGGKRAPVTPEEASE